MENIQRNKLSMCLAVLGVMDTFKTVWQSLTGIAAMVTRLVDLTEAIKEDSGIQGTARTGVAQGKNRKQVVMINLATEVAGDLQSLAANLGDDELLAKADVEVSDLVNTSDTLVAGQCREIHKLGVAHATGIAPLGTTAEDLAALDAAIVAYSPLANAPRKAIIDGKQVTLRIEAKTKEADALLRDELDKSMRKFKRKAPEFAQAYADARIIVDLGGGPGTKAAAPTPKPATTLTTGGLQPA